MVQPPSNALHSSILKSRSIDPNTKKRKLAPAIGVALDNRSVMKLNGLNESLCCFYFLYRTKGTIFVDKVCIQGLLVHTVIGVYDWERIESRELLIDVVLSTDLQKASETDDVLDTIDYALVAECIQAVAKASEFQLLESLGGAIFKALFAKFHTSLIDLTIHKPDILPDAKDVSINMIRQRS